MTSINDLPDEVLEFILTSISPYQDLHECMRVSKRWRKCVLNVVKTRRRNLLKSISEFDVKWNCITDSNQSIAISKRYSHSAVVHDNSMYIFGGCTCSLTTFNDLWRFDLSKRQWIRPLATGTYPSPKACSSLAYYNNKLVLFGGWTYPPSYPLYQSWHLFDELHIYDIEQSHWKTHSSVTGPPPTAGHSASIIGDSMIIFGGLTESSAVDCKKSNDVWKLDLLTLTWYNQKVQGADKPRGRFGQTQVILDEENIFIIGGSGGSAAVYSDAWILNMSDAKAWKWIPVQIKGKANKPANIWSNPGCKVGDKLIVLNRLQTETSFPIKCPGNNNLQSLSDNLPSSSARIDAANRQPDLDRNVNGRRGCFVKQKTYGKKKMASRLDLEDLARQVFNEPMYHMVTDDNIEFFTTRRPTRKNRSSFSLGLYVLDLEHALDEKPYVTWLSPKKFSKGPTETILYSLVEGKSEVIMFGGIKNDIKSIGQVNNEISNSLHFILAKDHVI